MQPFSTSQSSKSTGHGRGGLAESNQRPFRTSNQLRVNKSHSDAADSVVLQTLCECQSSPTPIILVKPVWQGLGIDTRGRLGSRRAWYTQSCAVPNQ
jgi:hypothetical protein